MIEQKKLSYPESSLELFFERGAELEPDPMSARLIKRLYFKWLRDDTDTRDFDSVFQERVDRYVEAANKTRAANKAKGKSLKIGNVEYDGQNLTISSPRLHRPLTVRNIKKNSLKKFVRSYCKQYVSVIDYDHLIKNSNTDISIYVKA